MIEELSSGQLLEILMVADITAKLRTIKKSMLLKISHCFPNYFTTLAVFEATMREFTKIKTISHNFVNILHKLTSLLTVWAAHIIAWGDTSSFILN